MKQSIPPILITFAFVSFVLLPKAHAVTPAPDGGYPGGNTAEGTNALFSLSSGVQNTATGFRTLYGNTEGRDNTGNGYQALLANTIGVANTATGSQALYHNTTGSSNTATGASALWRNTGGSLNTATGTGALYNNTGGTENTAIGANALATNRGGNNNTAAGSGALYTNNTGNFNTAIGVEALEDNTSGDDNVATGMRSASPASWSASTCSSSKMRSRSKKASGCASCARRPRTRWRRASYSTIRSNGATLIAERLIDYIRVHLSQIGGITPGRKLQIFAEQFGVSTAWHGPGDMSPLAHAANIHIDLAARNFGIQEWSGTEPPNFVIQELKGPRDCAARRVPRSARVPQGLRLRERQARPGRRHRRGRGREVPVENSGDDVDADPLVDGTLQTP